MIRNYLVSIIVVKTLFVDRELWDKHPRAIETVARFLGQEVYPTFVRCHSHT
jgi:hypothetical protein